MNEEMKTSVIRVGAGRGFIVNGKGDSKIVITAGHCLPKMPPCMNFSDLGERTYRHLLGPIGRRRTITAECLFVDPISDLAVLGASDDQDLSKEHDAYQRFMEPLTAFSIGAARLTPMMQQGEPGWVLSLSGQWQPCEMSHFGGPIWICDDDKIIKGGMSGSPILSASGEAVCVIASNRAQVTLMNSLPIWILKENIKRMMAERGAVAAPAPHRPVIDPQRRLNAYLDAQATKLSRLNKKSPSKKRSAKKAKRSARRSSSGS